MTQDQARAWYVNVLMDKIREDPHPSSTHMFMVEQALETMPELVPEYMEILLDKVAATLPEHHDAAADRARRRVAPRVRRRVSSPA